MARWERIPGERLKNYWLRLECSGLEAVDCSKSTLEFAGCDALVLTGGVDVDPGLYGEQPWSEVDSVNRERDEFELALLRDALTRDLPVLAICRGHQLLNVGFGGSLLQHIAGGAHEDNDDDTRSSAQHKAILHPKGKLRAIYDADCILVNSRHHQAVTPERVGEGLLVTATTEDGLVEGLESASHSWVVSVQWHPERADLYIHGFDASGKLLFDAFANAIRAHGSPSEERLRQ